MIASQSFTEAVAVRVCGGTIVPVVDVAYSIITVGAGIILSVIVISIVEKEVIEGREWIVCVVSVWFHSSGRDDGFKLCRLVDQGRDSTTARVKVGNVGERVGQTGHSLEDISSEDHET